MSVRESVNGGRCAWRTRAEKEGATSMICPACKAGADVLRGFEAVTEINPEYGPRLIAKSREHHDQCMGKTRCDCQHKINSEENPA
jgi:hypothetical protein